MRRKSLRTKEKALEIPRLAKVILSVHKMVAVFFSQVSNLETLKTHQKDLRNQLFYVEQSLSNQLGKLPGLISKHIIEIFKSNRGGK